GLPDGAFFVGSGEKLLDHMDHVLGFAQEAVFRFEDEDAWAWQRRELKTLAKQFFAPFWKRPCIVRVHQFAWTRSFVHRALFPGGVSALEENRTVSGPLPRVPIRLGFDWEDENGVQIDGSRLRWVDPAEVEPDALGFGVLKESPDIHMPVELVNSFHRQRVA